MISRTNATSISLSAIAFAALVTYEGYTDKAVIPVPGDVPTVGFGTTNGVKLGDKTDPVKAVAVAVRDIQKFEGELKKCLGDVALTQYEYDAYLSLSYNVGPGAVCKSSIVPKLKAGKYEEACETIKQFNKFQGKPLKGLTIRREKEYAMCIGER